MAPFPPFALFDGDCGSALLLSGYRGAHHFAAGDDPDLAFRSVESALAAGEWVALAVDYEFGASLEPALASRKPAVASFQPARAKSASPGGRLRCWRFSQGRQLDANELAAFLAERLQALPEQQRVAGIADLSPALDAAAYAERVSRIVRWITAGDCYQINLTFPLTFHVYGDALALYASLRQRQPVRYGGYLAIAGETILSFSPELFFERCGNRVRTRPMKGTAARGRTPAEDAAQRAALLASAKERAENIMIVDLLRNDLGRLAQPGKVCVEALCEAEAYPTLWQMVSSVAAELPGARLKDLFAALFPCGSITGAPKIRAMQRIGELEASPRGLYTGALGWIAASGDCRFNVAIRTLELDADRRGKLGIGSGILVDADAQREYAECLLKAQFLTAFDPGFELVETLRLEFTGHTSDPCYPLLKLHLERLQASAQALGFACDAARLRAALTDAAAELASNGGPEEGERVYRVRLTLAHDGSWRIVSARLADEAPEQPLRVVLANETLSADDLLLRHKTTARSLYERVLAGLASRPQVFDAIFLNSRGEVCEGARSNVFVERDGVLLTPPLCCGLLPGVLRRTLLDSGRAVESLLRREDLAAPSRLYVGNAVRGLLPVILDS